MKLKLDENLGRRGHDILRAAGHDVATVSGQGVQHAEDTALIDLCRQEGRAIVTLDLDFANPLRFKPSLYPGIAVLRLPTKPSAHDLIDLIQALTMAWRRSNCRGGYGLSNAVEFEFSRKRTPWNNSAARVWGICRERLSTVPHHQTLSATGVCETFSKNG